MTILASKKQNKTKQKQNKTKQTTRNVFELFSFHGLIDSFAELGHGLRCWRCDKIITWRGHFTISLSRRKGAPFHRKGVPSGDWHGMTQRQPSQPVTVWHVPSLQSRQNPTFRHDDILSRPEFPTPRWYDNRKIAPLYLDGAPSLENVCII